MFGEQVKEQERAMVVRCYEHRFTNIFLGNPHSQDGPMTKWIRAWLKEQKKGSGKLFEEDVDMEDSQPSRKRQSIRSRVQSGR